MGKTRDLSKKIRSEEHTSELQSPDLIDRVPDELWMEVHDIVQEAVIKTIPKKKMQKGEMVV